MDVSPNNTAALEAACGYLKYDFAQALQCKGADLIIGDIAAASTIQEAKDSVPPLDASGYKHLTKTLVAWQTELQGVATQLTAWDNKLDELKLDKSHLTVLHDRVTELRADRTDYLDNVARYLKQAEKLNPDLEQATTTLSTEATPPPLQKLTKPPQTWWQYLESPFICS